MIEQQRALATSKGLPSDERLLRILPSRGRVAGALFTVSLLTLGAAEIAGRLL